MKSTYKRFGARCGLVREREKSEIDILKNNK